MPPHSTAAPRDRARAPLLDPRDVGAVLASLEDRRGGYVPEWTPADRGPGAAVLQAYARFLRALAERVNEAPEKHKLAFLEMLGVTLLPAQAARAPVVFTAMPDAGDGRIPARTRLGARVPGRAEPLVFETEDAIALAGARIAEVKTLWPGRDAWADHDRAALGGQPFTLFEGMRPVPHELYLAHDVHFALAGMATVDVEVQLARAARAPLAMAWEYWDGETWRGFLELADVDRPNTSFDGTSGMTRSGVVQLRAHCAETAPTAVRGVVARWIRARLTTPFPPDVAAPPPAVDRVLVRTVIDRTLPGSDCTGGLLPDVGLVEGQPVDFTKAFRPLGQQPLAGSALYLACDEAFGKPGAEVTICVRRGVSPEEEADALGQKYELDVDRARRSVLETMKSVDDIEGLLGDIDTGGLAGLSLDLFKQDPAAWYAALIATMRTSLGAVKQGAVAINGAVLPLVGQDTISDTVQKLSRAALALVDPGSVGNLPQWTEDLTDLLTNAAGAPPPVALQNLRHRTTEVLNTLLALDVGAVPLVIKGTVPDFFSDGVDPQAWLQTVKNAVQSALTGVTGITQKAAAMAQTLSTMEPVTMATGQGVTAPALSAPLVAWEYWNGGRWAALLPEGDDGPVNFTASGEVRFVAPDDWTPSMVNDESARWLRIRLVSGSYGKLRLVSWKEESSGAVNFMPVIEPRAPLLDALRIGYLFRSPTVPPQHCLAYNDFRWADHSDAARWRGGAFEPFSPVEDRTPALYIGFDAPPPLDRLGLYLAVREVAGETDGPPLVWEHWTGTEWLPLPVRDGTRGLALPGMVQVTWPSPPPPRPAPVARAEGREIRLADARDAARFFAGDELYVEGDGRGELLIVETVRHDVVVPRVPLGGEYAPAAIGPPRLPRFGTPRSWLRARLRADGPPRPTVLDGLHLNAVWAAQIETIDNELLGSSTAQVHQTLFFRRTPVLEGQVVEVRELDGPRAHIEWPMLREELVAAGIAIDEVRLVEDRQTRRVIEVWVPWSERPSLAFSRPADRHYTIERVRGRLGFGDDVHGRVPPAGADNVRARRYRSGGGAAGNVPAGAIDQVLAGVLAQRVTNPIAAEGGAESEPVSEVSVRGPTLPRHRRQAISADDYEALAREASPAVAVARALPLTHPSGRAAIGWVTVVIMPRATDARPQPSFELREHVRAFLAARAPSTVAPRITVIGPRYLPVAVEATVVPLDPGAAGVVRERALRALDAFFHPLTGGPEGAGWPFGRDVHLSDVAARLAAVDGVDYVPNATMLLDGVPVGDHVDVPHDRVVVAGDSRLRLAED